VDDENEWKEEQKKVMNDLSIKIGGKKEVRNHNSAYSKR
jgi:hypothetical protein